MGVRRKLRRRGVGYVLAGPLLTLILLIQTVAVHAQDRSHVLPSLRNKTYTFVILNKYNNSISFFGDAIIASARSDFNLILIEEQSNNDTLSARAYYRSSDGLCTVVALLHREAGSDLKSSFAAIYGLYDGFTDLGTNAVRSPPSEEQLAKRDFDGRDIRFLKSNGSIYYYFTAHRTQSASTGHIGASVTTKGTLATHVICLGNERIIDVFRKDVSFAVQITQ